MGGFQRVVSFYFGFQEGPGLSGSTRPGTDRTTRVTRGVKETRSVRPEEVRFV